MDMLIVAGHLMVAADDRDAYVDDCIAVVEQARRTPGCLDFALTADSVEPCRVNVYERWRSMSELEAFRGSGPDADTRGRIHEIAVREYDIAEADRS